MGFMSKLKKSTKTVTKAATSSTGKKVLAATAVGGVVGVGIAVAAKSASKGSPGGTIPSGGTRARVYGGRRHRSKEKQLQKKIKENNLEIAKIKSDKRLSKVKYGV